VDDAGNLFVSTGNGVFDVDKGGKDYGDTLLKLAVRRGAFTVLDYFTPSEQAELTAADNDLGSGGPVLLPQQHDSPVHLALIAGKGGTVYVVNRDHMGRFVAGQNPHAIQTIKMGGSVMGAPAYWNGHVFYFASKDVLKDFAVQGGRLSDRPVAVGPNSIVDPGATPSVSANGATAGVVWVVQTKGWNSEDRIAVLYAYDASNIAHVIYNSDEYDARDRMGVARRFVIPIVANGHVYVGTSGGVDVFGLLPQPKVSGLTKKRSK
jgi:hypothetical protein